MKINIMALGDVGQNLLLGLKLMGADVIDDIGIYDINQNQLKRLEMEMGQIFSFGGNSMPRVGIVSEENLLDCDILIFCASKGVPPVGTSGDVRMAQLKENGELIRNLGGRIKRSSFGHGSIEKFSGMVMVMSDPVDELCEILLKESGLEPERIRGLGLGVMNARAVYVAERDVRFSAYLKDGRVYGPHGRGLIVANSISDYDDELSCELTELVSESNIKVRELGYKPFIAPAISSGALSVIGMLRGKWTYGSIYIAEYDTYFGCLSRMNGAGKWETEDVKLPEKLNERIEKLLISRSAL